MTLHVTGGNSSSVLIYDVAGAAATGLIDGAGDIETTTYNGTDGITCGANATPPCSGAPTIIPGSVNGLTIACTPMGNGPTTGLASPAGAVFDTVNYTGQSDGDKMDNADGWGHFFNPNAAREDWNWYINNGGVVSGYSSVAIHLRSQ